jgi:hypothetical protein
MGYGLVEWIRSSKYFRITFIIIFLMAPAIAISAQASVALFSAEE